jgi:hypothetical protein
MNENFHFCFAFLSCLLAIRLAAVQAQNSQTQCNISKPVRFDIPPFFLINSNSHPLRSCLIYRVLRNYLNQKRQFAVILAQSSLDIYALSSKELVDD